MTPRRPRARLAAAAGTALALGIACPGVATAAPPSTPPKARTPIEHVVVLMQANHSFDSYFGTYPGADGPPAGACVPKAVGPGADPKDCVKPHRLGDGALGALPVSSRAVALEQLHGGSLDGFVAAGRPDPATPANPAIVGHYDGSDIPWYWNAADEYVLFDRFFTSSLGGKLTNRMFWVTGAAGQAGAATTDRIPAAGFTAPTIFDRLQAEGISWKFYVENYDPAITYRSRQAGDRGAQIKRVPLLNYARFLDDPERFKRIVDVSEYHRDLERGTLPAVSFIASSASSEHPPGSVQAGQAFVRTLVGSAMRSSAWPSTAFLWTYDDWGGFYDHVRPPQVDRSGYGFRAPALLVSPYARRGYIDHTTLDVTSVLKFIEQNWGLAPLAGRDRAAQSIAGAFDFARPPRKAAFIGLDRTQRAVARPRRWVVFGSYLGALAAAGLLIAVAVLAGRRGRRDPATTPAAPDEVSAS